MPHLTSVVVSSNLLQSRFALPFLQMHRTAHNIHEAGRQTWSTARAGVTRPSSLLALFSRRKPDEEWGDAGNDNADADHRRQLLRYGHDQASPRDQETAAEENK